MHPSGQLRKRNRLSNGSACGFSILELVVAVTIILILAGVALPSAMQTWYDLQLRSAGSQVADLMQRARMVAAKRNAICPIGYRVNNGLQQVYLDLNRSGNLDAGDPYIDLPSSIVAAAGAPTGGTNQPPAYALNTDTTSGTPYDNTNTLAFSSRGLPCNYVSTTTPPTCTTPSASYFVYYFQDNRPTGLVAVLVTKAGRTKVLLWNGTTWN